MSNGYLRLIRDTLEEEHIYDELPDKAIHKLSYLVSDRLEERGMEAAIPYFWYRYGVLTQQLMPSGTEAPSSQLTRDEEVLLNQVTNSVLDDYYDSTLEEITDLTYRDAPYDTFRHWRELDKQISGLQGSYNPFFDNTPIRNEIEEKIERVYDSFPNSEFPHHESDLSNWYFMMTRELDMDLENIQRLQDINTTFWEIFTLSVAEKHNYNMTVQEVQEVLGIQSFETERRKRREKLSTLGRRGLEDRFNGGNSDLNATTDAMIEPILESF